MRALLRRPPNVLNRVLSIGNISLDTRRARCRWMAARRTDPTGNRGAGNADAQPHRPVAKRALEEAVYSFSEDVSPNAIEAAVSRVRRRLDSAGARVTISAARGMGYLLSERAA